ncbi:MAG: hypothetical protein ACXVZV_15465, partial [Terriglobales bacterium]
RWWWAAVPVLAALVIVAVLLGLRTRTPKPVEVAHVPEANTTAPAVPAKAIAPVAHEHPRPHRKVAHRSTPPTPVQQQPPRLATFPSRDGDDELVRLAVRFVQAQPAVAAQITQEQNDFRQMAEAFTAPLRSSSDQKTSEER